MSAHTLSRSTLTVELLQVTQINEHLRLAEDADADLSLTAAFLKLGGATVRPRVIDTAAMLVIPVQERRGVDATLPAAAVLRRVLAIGPPTAPYLYGVFAEPGAAGRRELPVTLHTEHLRAISTALNMRRHLWGV